MDDLISRTAAIEWFFRPYSNEESYSNLDVERALKAIPAVDAAPVVHGRWVKPERSLWPVADCSVCGEMCIVANTANYCPNCGAKMENNNATNRC